MERTHDLTNSNRIRGSNGWTSGQEVAKSISIKGRDCRSGEYAGKEAGFTPGDLRRVRRQCRRTDAVAGPPDRDAEVSNRPRRWLKARTVPEKGLKEREGK